MNAAVFALGLAGADLPVLPLLPRSKQPRLKRSFHHATTDPDWINRHWYYHPDDNIGVRPPLGMAVLDIDPRNGGRSTLAQMVAEHGPLPETWCATTGSGGWHYWFVVGEMTPRGKLGAGVDVKHGDTGFVVAPPSIHPNGERYVWLTPPVGDPAAAPDWLIERLRPPVYIPSPVPINGNVNGKGRYSLLCLVRRIERAPEGKRHDTVRGAFMDAAAQGDLDAFEPALTIAALAAERSPTEIDAIIRYAEEKGGR